ncbi:MAG: GTPase ObgE [Negativibacillus sp.]
MFIDKAVIRVKAGDGGNGAVSFHREKFVAAGGPDGGDGGKGGDIVFVGSPDMNTLIDFKYKKNFIAENGQKGGPKRCSGKGGQDLVIKVPMGTIVRDGESGQIMADISGEEPVIIAKGGNGGWGNSHFATPTRQIPRFAKPGIPGEKFDLQLELKLLADVGLVGFPNVGKSTLISVVSAAKPKIANYHFTTLTPVLGVVKVAEGKSFVMADIPGLIEGASEGIGLGHEFLRHVERCRLIVHVVDVSGSEGRDPKEDFETINRELANFNAELAAQEQIVVGNKADMASDEQVEEFRRYIEEKGLRFFRLSAATHQGVEALVQEIAEKLDRLPPIKRFEADYVPKTVDLSGADKWKFDIKVEDGVYIVEADWLVKVFGMISLDDEEDLGYFQRILRSSGIIDRLEEMGIQEGDTVSILNFEFDYIR